MGTFAWRRRPTRHFGEQWIPYAELSIRDAGGRWRSFSVQVDSGAVISVLPRSAAELLGLTVEQGERIELAGVGGPPRLYYIHRVSARLTPAQFDLRIAIADGEDVPSLLGRLDVLERWQIDLDPSLQETQFRAPWLDAEEREIFRHLVNTDTFILSRLAKNPLPTEVDEALRRLVKHAASLLGSTAGLLKLHRTYDVPLLIRSLFELSVQAEYLMQSPSDRAPLYLDYAHITKYEQAEAWSAMPGIVGDRLRASNLRVTGQARNRAEYDRVLDRYAPNGGRPRRHWYPGSFREIARAVGRESEYLTVYALFSGHAHSDSWVLEQAEMPPQQFWHACFYWGRLLKLVADAKKIVVPAESYRVLETLARGFA